MRFLFILSNAAFPKNIDGQDHVQMPCVRHFVRVFALNMSILLHYNLYVGKLQTFWGNEMFDVIAAIINKAIIYHLKQMGQGYSFFFRCYTN